MAARTYRLQAAYERTPASRRATGFALAIGINLLVLFILIGLGTRHFVDMKQNSGTLIFDVARQDDSAATKQPKQQQRKQQPVEQPKLPPPEIILPVKPTITPPPTAKLEMVELTKQEMSTTDQAMAARSAPAVGPGTGKGGDSAVVGTGPRGETLYAAEWLREPTDQEIGNYITASTGAGYGLIACKTYPNYRVDDCYRLGSVPASAQVDKVLINAAWQFKVRPPRKNGQPMIGEWVRIRFDYITRRAGD